MLTAFQNQSRNETLSLSGKYLDKLDGSEIRKLIASKITPNTKKIDLSKNFLGLMINGFDIDEGLEFLGACRRFGSKLCEAFLGISDSVECLDLSRNYLDELRKPTEEHKLSESVSVFGVFGGIPGSVSSVIFRENYLGKTPHINEALTALSTLPETVNYIDLRDNALLANPGNKEAELTNEELESFFSSIIRKGRRIDVDSCVLERLLEIGVDLEGPAEKNKLGAP